MSQLSRTGLRRVRSTPFQYATFESDPDAATKRSELIKEKKLARRLDDCLEVKLKSLIYLYKEELIISERGPDIVKLFSIFNIDSNSRAKCTSETVAQRLEEWKSEVKSAEWYKTFLTIKIRQQKLSNQLRAIEDCLDQSKRLLQANKTLEGLAASLKGRAPEMANRMIEIVINRELKTTPLRSSQEDNEESEEES